MIWWLDQAQTEQVVGMLKAHKLKLPAYLCRQVWSRYGRPGRGRLWQDYTIHADVAITSWPMTPLAKRLERAGGIVLKAGDEVTIAELPGIVTDTRLELPCGAAQHLTEVACR